jgi:hypothetical protein
MIRKLLFLPVILIGICSTAQLKSPQEFLGYKIGERFTPHWRVVSYFQHVATTTSGMVKLEQYGETNEHRPLYLAYISSEDNIRNLEKIRQNNLQLTGLAQEKTTASENTPAVVWLSYNVHGNEASSSEASMLTVFALVDPTNTQTKDWLKNTVVIIDPCVNPDGRDRYVNWFNSVAGLNYNPNTNAREHREPWPGGRTNHYNFDLNRDWAWQTQIESRERMIKYNQWMPEVHVDFHEQGINQPYYFAPAAQPYHEAITQWQRDFQVTIGKNHAKYFDRNGWLYFTKEIFDLFYPSYGDTYPVYNGAIGMTYEQGGGPAGGLGALTDEEDTLTLADRAIHHFTTGMSTIEVSSLNSSRLVKEFHKFFTDAMSNGAGDYKSYIIPVTSTNVERLYDLFDLLKKNDITFGMANVATGKGFNYATGKEETFKTSNAIVVSGIQPKAALVRVLFEPKSKLVDSITYDITAWSLPYAYGLEAYASKEKIDVEGPYNVPFAPNSKVSDYGYVIPWRGVLSAKAVAQLLQKEIRLRFCEMPFEASGQKFDRGSVLILKKGNERFGKDLDRTIFDICNENRVTLYAVASGMVDKGFDFGSSKVHPLKAPKVALLTGEGVSPNAAGEVWHFFEQELQYPITLINTTDFNRSDWNAIDVMILPNGSYKFLNEKSSEDQFYQWLRNGGRVIALESAVDQLAKQDWSEIHLKKEFEKDTARNIYSALRAFENREKDEIPGITPGSIFRVELDNTHPLAYGYPTYYYTLKMDTTMYDFIKENGWNVGVIKKDEPLAGFVGYKLKRKLKDGLVFGVQDVGEGTVTYLTDNVLFRNFWEYGKLMFCNAVFMVGQ